MSKLEKTKKFIEDIKRHPLDRQVLEGVLLTLAEVIDIDEKIKSVKDSQIKN